MPSYRITSNRPSSGILSHGADANGVQRALLIDDFGRVVTTNQSSVESNIKIYRSDSLEAETQVVSAASKLVHLKGAIDPGATDDTTFYIHVLDATSTPAEDAAVDPITTLAVNHNNGFASEFAIDGARTFTGCDNGLLVVMSTDRFTYDTNNLVAADQAYFEVDYLEA